ncbi:Phosphatidylglycerophosphatase and protein-tyrosine phosphatase 1 [Choanephora cucurbitarum]|uniref:Phosphatidylglycerophosphatase and protein-tyrosine phosphatase 1 n=1 Tax=Choanephora cucurbitarum TaxID=101091 RepID=A0A1C7NSD3_9FUNG|nr:Phosphatidylglycerophosphatase and protein-tyrosine phosphatase 1 [Choanephora cucurbitarum]
MRLQQQHSSLGISQALEEEIRKLEEEQKNKKGNRNSQIFRSDLTDAMFKVPSQESSFLTWSRFYISLYYNKLAVNMFGFLTGWSWYNRIDGHLILGALPTPSQIKTLRRQENVDTVINLCAEFPGYKKLYKELDIQQIRLGIPDYSIPPVESIQHIIQQIDDRKQQNPKSTIYLHCKAGRGRSAIIAVCYLLRTYKLDLMTCQKLILERRTQVDKDLCQTDQVRLFYKNILSDIESGKLDRVSLINQ